MRYKILDHVTDLKLKIFGRNLIELFTNAALALFESITDKKSIIKTNGKIHQIKITSADQESLMVDWLNELLFLHSVHKENYFNIKINRLSETELEAKISGNPSRADKIEIKAVTYHDLKITKTKNGYEAIILFDI